MLVGRCIPRDTRRYGIAFPPISFSILSRLFGQADRCIENSELAECALFWVSGSLAVGAPTRLADWTLPAPFGLQFAICFTT